MRALILAPVVLAASLARAAGGDEDIVRHQMELLVDELDAMDHTAEPPRLPTLDFRLSEIRRRFKRMPYDAQNRVMTSLTRGRTIRAALSSKLPPLYRRLEELCAVALAPGGGREPAEACTDRVPFELAEDFWQTFGGGPSDLRPAFDLMRRCDVARIDGAKLRAAAWLARSPGCDGDPVRERVFERCDALVKEDLARTGPTEALAARLEEAGCLLVAEEMRQKTGRPAPVVQSSEEKDRRGLCDADMARLKAGQLPSFWWSNGLAGRFEGCGGRPMRDEAERAFAAILAKLRAEQPCELVFQLSLEKQPLEPTDVASCEQMALARVAAEDWNGAGGALSVLERLAGPESVRVSRQIRQRLGTKPAVVEAVRSVQLRSIDATTSASAVWARAVLRDLLKQHRVADLAPAPTALLAPWPVRPSAGQVGSSQNVAPNPVPTRQDFVSFTYRADCKEVERTHLVHHDAHIEHKSTPVSVNGQLGTRHDTIEHYARDEVVSDGSDTVCSYSDLVIDAPFDWPDAAFPGLLDRSPVEVFDREWPKVRADWMRRGLEAARRRLAAAPSPEARLDAAVEVLVYAPGDTAARAVLTKELPLAAGEKYPL